MKPAVTQPRRRGARPGFPMRHKLAQLPFEAMEPMGMEVTGVVRHGLSRGSGEHRGRANQSSVVDGQIERSNGAFGKSDIEGKAARVAARELRSRTSFK